MTRRAIGIAVLLVASAAVHPWDGRSGIGFAQGAPLAGTIVVGSWLNRQDPLVHVEYENGWLTMQDGCGRVVGIDVTTRESRELTAVECGADWATGDLVAWSSDGRWMVHLAPAHMATHTAEPMSDTTTVQSPPCTG